jgi:hypothetical protein
VRRQLDCTLLQPIHGVAPIDRARVDEHCDEVRQTRVEVSRDTTFGLVCISAPVLDADGEASSRDSAGEVLERDAITSRVMARQVRPGAAGRAAVSERMHAVGDGLDAANGGRCRLRSG